MERIKVAIRLRPFLQNENESNTGINMNPDDDKTIMITKSLKTFRGTFDKILSVDSTQKDVFDFIKPCLSNIKKGNNCTILAYGQTGSGKTYTMFGGDWSFNDNLAFSEKKKNLQKDEYNFILNKELVIDPFSETNGIIPNLIMNLFSIYNNNKNNEENKDNSNLNIKCSYIQVYNEKIYDLLDNLNELNSKKPFLVMSGRNKREKLLNQESLKIKYDKNKGMILEGVNEINTNSFYDLFEILVQGETNRKIRQTNKNDMSSRSHTIFIIDIEDNNSKINSKIKLCDLAGSERFNSSETYNKEHIYELCNINKSLFILGNIIHLLASKKRNQKFIPYKDSKLTQILEDSLSGNSSIYLIATISPKDENFNETINTLKFADKAHEVMISMSPKDAINNDIFGEGNKKEIFKLYKELSELKQLLLLREKRGNLNPLQAQFLQLKKENSQLKKFLGGDNNINIFEKLIKENNYLKREIKELTSQNLILKNENNIYFKENNNNDYNDMILDFKKKTFKNSLSDNNIFNNYDYNRKIFSKNISNSNTLINTGNIIISNKNHKIINDIIRNNTYEIKKGFMKEKGDNISLPNLFLSKQNSNKNGNTISNNINKKRLKAIKSNYGLNYNNINLIKLGINAKFNKNNKIMESLKRLKILDDLSNKNNNNIFNNNNS